MVLRDYVTNQKHSISTTTITMVTKLSRMVTNYEGLQPVTSHDPSITWPCEVMFVCFFV